MRETLYHDVQYVIIRLTRTFSTGLLSVSHISSSTMSLEIALTLTLSTEPDTTASYTISHFNTNSDCFDTNGIDAIHASETMYTLTDLEEGTEYSITVTALLSDGETAEDSLTATTMASGEFHIVSHFSPLF